MRSVAAIFTSPVKSLALNRPESVTVGYSGIVDDRRFHLVDGDGRLLTQRQQGKLVLVQSRYSVATEMLTSPANSSARSMLTPVSINGCNEYSCLIPSHDISRRELMRNCRKE